MADDAAKEEARRTEIAAKVAALKEERAKAAAAEELKRTTYFGEHQARGMQGVRV